jgi:uncharacterized protein YbaR (Trm112 family)
MPSTACPECETQIPMSKSAREGEALTCKTCGSYLKIVSLYPFELDWDDEEEDMLADDELDFDDEDFDSDDDW